MLGIIREVIAEAVQTAHFADRVSERLLDPERISPPLDRKVVIPMLELLDKLDFPPDANIGIKMFQSGTVFKAYVSDSPFPSVGNTLWAIVKGNDLITTMFAQEGKTPNGVQYVVSLSKLKRIVEERGSYLITTNDLLPEKSNKEVRRRGGEMNLPIVSMGGKSWYADSSKEVFYYTKNVNKTMTFDQAFATMSEPELDAMLDQLSAQTA